MQECKEDKPPHKMQLVNDVKIVRESVKEESPEEPCISI